MSGLSTMLASVTSLRRSFAGYQLKPFIRGTVRLSHGPLSRGVAIFIGTQMEPLQSTEEPIKALVPNRAGCICFNLAGQVLLVTAKGKTDEWVFPKGHIEADEDSSDAAEREVLEEAGIRCITYGESVGYSSFDYLGEKVVVEWWPGLAQRLEERHWFDVLEGRKVKWVTYAEAINLLGFDDLKQALRQALCIPEEE